MALTMPKPPGWSQDGSQKPPQLIELTAKRWKGLMLVAFLFGILGISVLIWQIWTNVYKPLIELGFVADTPALPNFGHALTSIGGILGLLLFGASLAIGFYARIMAWWRHG